MVGLNDNNAILNSVDVVVEVGVELGKRHTDKIHGEPDAFECEFCDFKTKFEFNLRRRKEKKHEVIGKGTGIKGRQVCSCRRCDFTTFDQSGITRDSFKKRKKNIGIFH